MTAHHLYAIIVISVVLGLMVLGGAISTAIQSVWLSPTAQELQACRETCRPWTVHEFHTDGNGNSVCICN